MTPRMADPEDFDQPYSEDEFIIVARTYEFPREETIDRRDWLLGRHLSRGEVSGTAAMGGTGKSNMSIVEALAMVSGRQLTYDTVPRPLRVVLINLEDKRSEMQRRIAAAMRHYNLTAADIGDRLIVIAKGEVKIKVARMWKGNFKRNEQTISGLSAFMRGKNADVLSIDSFIRTHSVNENDNSAVQDVVECFEDVAERANCGIHLWHHSRKSGGERATVESARGAQAFIDSCRSVRIMETMSRKERDELQKIMPDIGEPGYYFREFNGKRNFAPPSDQSDWFKYISLQLHNWTSEFEADGDNIGVITRWNYPRVDLPPVDFAQVCTAIAAGGPWRADARSTAEPWVGVAVAQVAGVDLLNPIMKKAVAKLVKDWLGAGWLRVVTRSDRHRQDREYVEVRRS